MHSSNESLDANSVSSARGIKDDLSSAEASDCSSSENNDFPRNFGAGFAHKMRRVDWRWAAAKGFLNKETNEWNEAMGGQEAYLKQRNDRMLARMKRSREAKEMRSRKEDQRQDNAKFVATQSFKKATDRGMKKANATKSPRKDENVECATRPDHAVSCGNFPSNLQSSQGLQDLYSNILLTAQNLQVLGGHLFNQQNSMRLPGMPLPANADISNAVFGMNPLGIVAPNTMPCRVPSIGRLDSSGSFQPQPPLQPQQQQPQQQQQAEQQQLLPSLFPSCGYDFGRLSSLVSLNKQQQQALLSTALHPSTNNHCASTLPNLALDGFAHPAQQQQQHAAFPSLLPHAASQISALGQLRTASSAELLAAAGGNSALSEVLLRSGSAASVSNGGVDLFGRPQSWVPCFSRVVSQSAA